MNKTIAHACEALVILSNNKRITELPSALWHLEQAANTLRDYVNSNPFVPIQEGTVIEEGDFFENGLDYKPTGLAGTPYHPTKHAKHFRRLLNFTHSTPPTTF